MEKRECNFGLLFKERYTVFGYVEEEDYFYVLYTMSEVYDNLSAGIDVDADIYDLFQKYYTSPVREGFWHADKIMMMPKLDKKNKKKFQLLLPANLLEQNYKYKKYIYQRYKNDKYSGLYEKNRKKVTNSKADDETVKNIIQTKVFQYLGYETDTTKVFTEMILRNSKVCLYLIEKEILPIWDTVKKKREKLLSFIKKVYEADKLGEPVIASENEYKVFWERVFHTKYYIVRDDNIKKDDIENYIECLSTDKNTEETSEENESDKIDEEINEEKNSVQDAKNLIAEYPDKKIRFLFKEYLVFFLYFITCRTQYNPIIDSFIPDEKEKKNEFFKNKNKEIEDCSWLQENEKKVLKGCYKLIYYESKKKEKKDKYKICENYYKFVAEYLKRWIDGNNNKINLYLFEEVFGFAFVEKIVDTIYECLILNKSTFKEYKWSLNTYLIDLLMEIFRYGEVFSRISIAEYTVKSFFEIRRNRYKVCQMSGNEKHKRLKEDVYKGMKYVKKYEKKCKSEPENYNININERDKIDENIIQAYIHYIMFENPNKSMECNIKNGSMEHYIEKWNKEKKKVASWLISYMWKHFWEADMIDVI